MFIKDQRAWDAADFTEDWMQAIIDSHTFGELVFMSNDTLIILLVGC